MSSRSDVREHPRQTKSGRTNVTRHSRSKKFVKEKLKDKAKKEAKERELDVLLGDQINKLKNWEVDRYINSLFKGD